MLYSVALLASLALVLANAFFVASEFSIVKIRQSRTCSRNSSARSATSTTRTRSLPSCARARVVSKWTAG